MPRTQSDGTVILPDKFEVAVARKFSAPLSAIPISIRMGPAAGWGTLRDGQEIVLYNTSPKFSATTTNDDTYRAWPLEPRAVPPSFPAPPRVKFEGTTTNSDTYRQHELPAPLPVAAIPEQLRLPFEGTTTSQDAFRGIQLPAARPSVGLGMVDGGHHILIHRDSRLPAEAQQIFTTLHDGQNTAHLVLLEGENAHSAKVLGEFSLAGIPSAAKGAPRILVSFRISRSGLLTVHAKDLDGPSTAEWRQIDAISKQSLASQ